MIIPTYNNEKFIYASISSVINQTYRNLEIIIINDATPDNSMQIVEKFARDDKRIKIINHEQNKGVGASLNDGIAVAGGEFIITFSTDDTLDIRCIENMVARYFETGSDIICGNLLMNNDLCSIWDKELTFFTYNDKFSAVEDSKVLYNANLIHKNKIIFPEANLGEDTAFTLIACYYANHVSTCPKAWDFVNRIGHKSETRVSAEYLAECRQRAFVFANHFLGGNLPEFTLNNFVGVRHTPSSLALHHIDSKIHNVDTRLQHMNFSFQNLENKLKSVEKTIQLRKKNILWRCVACLLPAHTKKSCRKIWNKFKGIFE